MLLAVALAGYRVHARQESRLEQLQRTIQERTALNRENDVDELRTLIGQLWVANPSPIGRHIPAQAVADQLGWDRDRLNAAAFRAAGDFRQSTYRL